MNRLDEHNQYDIQLINSTGAIIWQQKVRGDEFSTFTYQILVSALIFGNYILHVQDQYNLNYSQRIQIIK